jgi:ABC-type spermidine/putrescine transport system permease subunit I
MASAVTVIMVLILLVPLVILQINQKRTYLSQAQGRN